MSASTSITTPPAVAIDPTPEIVAVGKGRAEHRLAWQHPALAAVLALSAALNLSRLSQNGYANIFYSSGVKSMLRSWHNFLFVSFDPGGLISIDKPPLGLWLQALSAKLFGFSASSLLLPEAIAGVLAVGALYWAMSRTFGAPAALLGALALAVFPSFVAVSRDNNVDALLILLMILACGLALRAIESGRWRTLLGCAALIGLAFNTKGLAGYLILPGFAAAYLVGAPGGIGGRLLRLAAAGLAVAAVSSPWIAFVDLTPASQRPFVGGSLDNSELGLTFNYNGLGRVEGQLGGPGRIPVAPLGVRRARARRVIAPVLPGGRNRHPTAFGGPTGPLRLVDDELGDQGGWMLPFALLGMVALALSIWRSSGGGAQPPPSRPRRRDPRLAGLLVLGGWLVVEGAVLSFSKGIVHPYYVSALGPGTAAMVGGGTLAFTGFARNRDVRVALIAPAVAGTVVVQLMLLHRAGYMHWFEPVLIAGAAIGVLGLALRRLALPAMVGTLGVLLLAPAVYAASTWQAPVQGTFPAAGPRQAAGAGGLGVSAAGLRANRALASYVSSHRPARRWVVLTDASDTAAPLILLGYRAGALGGYSGTDPALDGAGLARLVQRGEARYVVLGGAYATRGGNRATAAVKAACKRIPARVWLPGVRSEGNLFLDDCAGRARRLAAADGPSGLATGTRSGPTLKPRRAHGGRRARKARSRARRPTAARRIRHRRAAAARRRRSGA